MLLTPRRNDRQVVVERLPTRDRKWSGCGFGAACADRQGMSLSKGRVGAGASHLIVLTCLLLTRHIGSTFAVSVGRHNIEK